MKTLMCIETGKKTKYNNEAKPWDRDDILSDAATRLVKREVDHKHDYVTIKRECMESEIYHALYEMTEHTGEWRTFKIID